MTRASDAIRVAIELRASYRSTARAAGLSVAYLSQIAAGQRHLSVAAAVKIAPLLRLSARKLLIMQLDDEIAAEREA